MFQIPKPKPLDQLNAIVIDQQALVRDSIKNTLFRLGIPYIRGADSAQQAMMEFRQRQFELVIIAFDLNTDKDGFHLLEELRFKGHIKKSTCVIFISADTDQTLVHSVIELQPDDFWTKPLDLHKIEKRLLKILDCRRLLYKPFYCADKQEYSRAIYYAQRYLKDRRFIAFFPKLQRLEGDCLCKLGEYADAELYYQSLVEQVNYGWVHIGLTHCLLKQDKLELAQQQVERLKQRADTRFTVHDMLANHYVDQGLFDKAYAEIQQATRLAPRNIERNKRSWDLARLNHDSQGQYNATLHMAKFAKNSIHDSPELSLNVIRSGIDLAMSATPGQSPQILLKVGRQLQEFRQRCSADMTEQLCIAEARILVAQGHKAQAESKLKALPQADRVDSLEDSLDKVKLLHSLGHREKALALLNKTKGLVQGDSFSSHIITCYLEQELAERQHIHFTPKELIEMASTYYKQKRFLPAYKALFNALQLSPRNTQIAMSMLKVLVEIDSRDKDMLEAQNRCLSLLDEVTLPEEQQSRLRGYKQILAHTSMQQAVY